jgi:hypothetical protein
LVAERDARIVLWEQYGAVDGLYMSSILRIYYLDHLVPSSDTILLFILAEYDVELREGLRVAIYSDPYFPFLLLLGY